MPVVLCTLPPPGRRAPPALEFALLIEDSATGGRRRMPYFTLDLPLPLQLALSEPLAWRLLALYNALPALHAAAAPAPAAAPAAAAAPAVNATLIVGLLAISGIDGSLFFRANAASRPKGAQQYVSSAALSMLPEQLDNVRLRLEGRELQHLSMRASALSALIQAEVRQEVFNIAFSLLYSYLGYLGTSAVGQGLSVASQSLKRFVGAEAGSSAPVSSLTDGVRQGAGSAVDGIFRGVKGVYQRPLAGARAGGGPTGFLKGVGQGIAGVVTMPVAGLMDLGASTMQGVNATITSALHGKSSCVVARARPQRALQASGAVGPFSAERALGHALLQLTVLQQEATAGKRSAFRVLSRRRRRARANAAELESARGDGGRGHQLDCFFVVPGGKVVMLTTQCILGLHAPDFPALLANAQAERAGALAPGAPSSSRLFLAAAVGFSELLVNTQVEKAGALALFCACSFWLQL